MAYSVQGYSLGWVFECVSCRVNLIEYSVSFLEPTLESMHLSEKSQTQEQERWLRRRVVPNILEAEESALATNDPVLPEPASPSIASLRGYGWHHCHLGAGRYTERTTSEHREGMLKAVELVV